MGTKEKKQISPHGDFSIKRWLTILAFAVIGIVSWYQARVQMEGIQLKTIALDLNAALDPEDERWRSVDDIWAAVLLAEARVRDHGRYSASVVLQNIREASSDRPRILFNSKTKRFYVAWGGFRGLRLG